MLNYIFIRGRWPALVASIEKMVKGEAAVDSMTLRDVASILHNLLGSLDGEELWLVINDVLVGVENRLGDVCDTRLKALMAWIVEDQLNASNASNDFISRLIRGYIDKPLVEFAEPFPFKKTVHHFRFFAIFALILLHKNDSHPSVEDLRDIHQLLLQIQLSKQMEIFIGDLKQAEKRWNIEEAASKNELTLKQHTKNARNVKEQRDAEMREDAIALYSKGLASESGFSYGKWRKISEAIDEIFRELNNQYKRQKKRFLVDSDHGRQTMGRWFRPYSKSHREGKKTPLIS